MYILIRKKSKTFVYNDFTFVVFHLDLFKFTLQHTAAMAQLIERSTCMRVIVVGSPVAILVSEYFRGSTEDVEKS